MGEVGDAYAGCRIRVTELTGGLDAAAEATPVCTCPKWTVHDVVAHLSGLVDDALAGRLDGVATDPWTAAQVDARRDRPIADMLAEWDAQAPPFEELLDAIGDMGRQAVTDAVTHEHDIRVALGRPGARESAAVEIGLRFVGPHFVESARSAQGLSVRIEASDGTTFGDPGAALVLTGDAFDLLRAMTGRRNLDQLRAMHWSGDPSAALPAFTFGPFKPAEHPIDE